MVCQVKDTYTWNCVDLCDAPECVAAEVVRPDLDRPHLPTHDLIKVRRVVHLGQIGQLEKMAKSAVERAKQLIGLRSDTYACDHGTNTFLEHRRGLEAEMHWL
jgi:hypothetical protein